MILTHGFLRRLFGTFVARFGIQLLFFRVFVRFVGGWFGFGVVGDLGLLLFFGGRKAGALIPFWLLLVRVLSFLVSNSKSAHFD